MAGDQFSSYEHAVRAMGAVLGESRVWGTFGGFDLFEEPAQTDPGHRIPITPQILAREAELQRERAMRQSSPAQEWRDKARLDPANLRTAPIAEPTPGRVADNRRFVLPHAGAKRHSGRHCEGEGCPQELSIFTKRKLCRACYWKAYRAAPGAGPGAPIPKRMCVNGCGFSVRRSSETGVCAQCNARAKRRAEPKKPQVACESRCGRMLRPGRKGGFCYHCRDLAIARRSRIEALRQAVAA